MIRDKKRILKSSNIRNIELWSESLIKTMQINTECDKVTAGTHYYAIRLKAYGILRNITA